MKLSRLIACAFGFAALIGVDRVQAQAPTGTVSAALFDLAGATPNERAAAFTAALAAELGNIPAGSGSQGFLFTLDRQLLLPMVVSQSFGPVFSETAFTIGKGQFSYGMTAEHLSYVKWNGTELDTGVNIAGAARTSTAASTPTSGLTSLHASMDRVVFTARMGITGWLDIAVAAPVSRVSIDGRTDAVACVSACNTGSAVIQRSVESSGVEDIILDAKGQFFSNQRVRSAAGIDVRLPTGDPDNFHGIGTASVKPYFATAVTRGKVTSAFTVGYVFAGGSESSNETAFFRPTGRNEFDYSFYVEAAVRPRVTLLAEMLGRRLASKDGSALVRGEDITHLMSGVAGGKVNVSSTLILSLSCLFSLTDTGLVHQPSPVIAFEYTF